MDTVFLDGLERLVERGLVGIEWLVPDSGAAKLVFDLEQPTWIR